MTAEHLVPSLETCRALKAAGFPQETFHGWGGNPFPLSPSAPADAFEARGLMKNEPTWFPIECAAPTLAEVLDALPQFVHRPVPEGYYGPGTVYVLSYTRQADDDEAAALEPRIGAAIKAEYYRHSGDEEWEGRNVERFQVDYGGLGTREHTFAYHNSNNSLPCRDAYASDENAAEAAARLWLSLQEAGLLTAPAEGRG